MALIALLTTAVKEVYMIFNNEYLLKRDKEEFDMMFMFADVSDKIHYSTSIPDVIADDSLIIIDEADTFMFNDPVAFSDSIKGNYCICLTATIAANPVEV